MIRPLRTRHRHWFAVLAVLLPVGLVTALALRPAPLAVGALPPELDPALDPGAPGHAIAGWDDLWRGAAVTTRVTAGPDGALRLDLEPQDPVAAPDLLVYWSARSDRAASPGDAAPGAPLQPRARLLGTFDVDGGARRLPLPAGAGAGGRLILFSLAWGETVAAAELPPLPAPAVPDARPEGAP